MLHFWISSLLFAALRDEPLMIGWTLKQRSGFSYSPPVIISILNHTLRKRITPVWDKSSISHELR